MSTTPIRTDSKPDVDEETEKILTERLATYDKDRKHTKNWSEVKANALRKLKHPQPR